jgi:hypothetical protein
MSTVVYPTWVGVLILFAPVLLVYAVAISVWNAFNTKRFIVERFSYALVPATAVSMFVPEYQRLGRNHQFPFSFGEVWAGPLAIAGVFSLMVLVALWVLFWLLKRFRSDL